MACYFLILVFLQIPPPDLEPARVAVENQAYGNALRLLDSFLESDTPPIEGRYLRGIALREHGIAVGTRVSPGPPHKS